MASSPPEKDVSAVKPSNFLRQVIERDLEQGTYSQRRWGGSPGDKAHHEAGTPDPARIRTRFPPEPNGYLHIGHAKSICLNFGLAQDYGGICHLRFDDTNPEKEEQEYVDAIRDAVHWLGYSWEAGGVVHDYHASNYFDFMYRAAEYLIETGNAYVDEQSAEEMRVNRGDFSRPGVDSPFRSRSPEENLLRFREMRDGKLPDGAAVLRAKIDMASPNINMRDPTIYRIKHAEHHNTGNKWCIYPMYTFAHPIEDALENITHSICTLEFEDQRPFYDWLLDRLEEGGLIEPPHPRQYEFARLNLTYVVTSKRKLRQLVDEGHVDGWDDPRMPTIVGLRRRGYTPESLRLFAERIGVSKANGWIDFSVLEQALRDDLDPKAPRAMAVLDAVKLVITNWDELMGKGSLDQCTAPVHPHAPERGLRRFMIGKELWIERSDYAEHPAKGFNRLYLGSRVRLKYGYVVECIGAAKDSEGNVSEVLCELIPDTKSGTPGSNKVKAKGVITWVSLADALEAEFWIYDRLFSVPQPKLDTPDLLAELNPNNLRIVTGYVEPWMNLASEEERIQFERHGYFARSKRKLSPGQVADVAALKFHRIAAMRDGWSAEGVAKSNE